MDTYREITIAPHRALPNDPAQTRYYDGRFLGLTLWVSLHPETNVFVIIRYLEKYLGHGRYLVDYI